MKTRPKFKIGDYVVAANEAQLTYTVPGSTRFILEHKLATPKRGWICGAVRRQLGVLHPRSDDEPARLEVTGTVLLWQVKTSLCSRPFEVVEGSLQLCSDTPPHATWTSGVTLTAEERQRLKDYFKANPRKRGPKGCFERTTQ
jgi:hypothetical protein